MVFFGTKWCLTERESYQSQYVHVIQSVTMVFCSSYMKPLSIEKGPRIRVWKYLIVPFTKFSNNWGTLKVQKKKNHNNVKLSKKKKHWLQIGHFFFSTMNAKLQTTNSKQRKALKSNAWCTKTLLKISLYFCACFFLLISNAFNLFLH